MPIIDFHSHILPGIDDGSRNLETSTGMLSISKEQGVDAIAATPHFYAWRDRIDSFLARRNLAYLELMEECMGEDLPDIHVGAEVAFFEGISKAEDITRLTIDGNDVMLLEMPFRPWTTADLDEVAYMVDKRHLTLIMAHVERYMDFRSNRKYIAELIQMPVYIQINAESLLDRKLKGKLIKMFENGEADLLGSDCHGMHHRVPNLADGRRVLKEKLGTAFMEEMDQKGAGLLGL